VEKENFVVEKGLQKTVVEKTHDSSTSPVERQIPTAQRISSVFHKFFFYDCFF